MKRKSLFCTTALMVLLLSGCTPNNTDDGAMVSEDDAKSIALDHAQLTANQVTFIKSEIDRDNGQENYEIEFYTRDHKEYDYEIDPYTGEILDVDYDLETYHN